MYLTRRMQQVIKRLRNGGFAWQDSRGMWCLPGEDKPDDRDFCHSATINRLRSFQLVKDFQGPMQQMISRRGETLARVLEAC